MNFCGSKFEFEYFFIKKISLITKFPIGLRKLGLLDGPLSDIEIREISHTKI